MLTLFSKSQLLRQLFVEKLTKCLFLSTSNLMNSEPKKIDKLFRSVELEVRSHDKAVIKSYTNFVKVIFLKFIK